MLCVCAPGDSATVDSADAVIRCAMELERVEETCRQLIDSKLHGVHVLVGHESVKLTRHLARMCCRYFSTIQLNGVVGALPDGVTGDDIVCAVVEVCSTSKRNGRTCFQRATRVEITDMAMTNVSLCKLVFSLSVVGVRVVDLRRNRLTYDHRTFTAFLKVVLDNDNIEVLDLQGNPVARNVWAKRIACQHSRKEVLDIRMDDAMVGWQKEILEQDDDSGDNSETEEEGDDESVISGRHASTSAFTVFCASKRLRLSELRRGVMVG